MTICMCTSVSLVLEVRLSRSNGGALYTHASQLAQISTKAGGEISHTNAFRMVPISFPSALCCGVVGVQVGGGWQGEDVYELQDALQNV